MVQKIILAALLMAAPFLSASIIKKPPVKVIDASNSELRGKFFVLAMYIAERGSLKV